MTVSKPRPNFFIVGAPKAGTTALYEYLREHPGVCMASYKEPHFFATDMIGYARAKTLAEYLGFFRHCSDNAIAIGEGSVWYLRSREALENIREFAPEGRIIVMLRNPVDLVRSFHAQALYSYIEEEKDLETAWRLQDVRAKGEHIPPGCQAVQTLMYRDLARLGEQVQRALDIFPTEQVKLIFFEDFIADTRREFESVLSFLGVEGNNRKSFPSVNEAKAHRIEWLGKFTMQAPSPIVKSVRAIRRTTGLDPMQMVRKLRKWNSAAKPKKKIGDEFRKELIEYFAEDVKLLAKLTNRDLSHWLKT